MPTPSRQKTPILTIIVVLVALPVMFACVYFGSGAYAKDRDREELRRLEMEEHKLAGEQLAIEAKMLERKPPSGEQYDAWSEEYKKMVNPIQDKRFKLLDQAAIIRTRHGW